MMNSVLLTGNLTKDAELLQINNSDRKYLKFTIAVNRYSKTSEDGRATDYIPVVYFTKSAEKLCTHLTKGALISVSGKLSIRSVQGKDGSRKYYTDVLANKLDFLGKKKQAAV